MYVGYSNNGKIELRNSYFELNLANSLFHVSILHEMIIENVTCSKNNAADYSGTCFLLENILMRNFKSLNVSFCKSNSFASGLILIDNDEVMDSSFNGTSDVQIVKSLLNFFFIQNRFQ